MLFKRTFKANKKENPHCVQGRTQWGFYALGNIKLPLFHPICH